MAYIENINNITGTITLPTGAATQTTLASLLAKDFATQTSLALVKAKTDNLDVALSTRLKPADTLAGVTTVAAVTAITNALPVGANVIGQVTANAGTNLNTSLLSTSAKQDTGNTSLSNLDTKTPALGQALAASSTPVVLTAAQLTALTPPAAIAGFALEAGHLAAIDTATAKIPALGQALAASSVPVVLTAAQLTTLTPVSTVTANAGTNLNTSALALETTLGGRLKPADTLAGVTLVGTVTTITNAVTITPPTLTKGTQGATGFSIQQLKDAGRNQTNFYQVIQIVTTNTDALMSLTGYKAGALVTATTTPAVVTVGKIYRIQMVMMDYTTIVTTPGAVRFTLRANLSGVVAITSPAVCFWEVGEPTGIAPVAGKKNTIVLNMPEGIEFAAGTGIGISMVGLNTVGAVAAVGYGRISIMGYEY